MENIYKAINVSIGNMYELPTFKSEQTNQGLLGEKVELLDQSNGFSQVRMEDGYEAWINSQQLCDFQKPAGNFVTLRSHVAKIYKDPSRSSQIIRDATIGRTLPAIEEKGSWIGVVLPDGQKGWLEKKETGSFPDLARESIVELSREFIGYPYCWGGRTPKGLDCSGFVQLVFSLLGIILPRDAWMQYEKGRPVSKHSTEALPGDLLFFSRDKKHIDHVGIGLGEEQIIHARGMVSIDSLRQECENFCPRLHRNFVEVRSYLY